MTFPSKRLGLIIGVAVAVVVILTSAILLSSKRPAARPTTALGVQPTATIASTPTLPATTTSITPLPTPPTGEPPQATVGSSPPSSGKAPSTPKPVPPTSIPVAPTATSTSLSLYPQLGVTTPDGDGATCGTATQPGKFPRVVITNTGGGTLNWYFTFPAESASLDFTYRLSATVNGQPAQTDVNHYYLAAGQTATFQLYQNTKGALAAESFKPLSGVPSDDMRIDFWNTDDPTYRGIQEQYPCTNYPHP